MMLSTEFKKKYPRKRIIEDLRDIHKGKEVYVMGCGPSLDDFPDEFFDDKLTIAVNAAFVGWPKCTYVHWWMRLYTDFMMNYAPSFVGKFIIPHTAQAIALSGPMSLEEKWKWVPYVYPDISGRPVKIEGDYLEKLNSWKKANFAEPQGNCNDLPIWMLWNGHPHSIEEQFQTAVDLIMQRKPAPYCKREPMVHTAIQAAAVMGANKITLVGCEHEWSKSNDTIDHHAKKVGWFYKTYNDLWQDIGYYPSCMNYHRDGTRWLAEMFGKHGIKVRRYFYDKKNKFFEDGYREIK